MLKDSKRRLIKWWSELTGRQQLGYFLAGLGIAITLTLALVRGFTTLSAGWSLFVAVVGVVFQGASAFAFGGVGKADPTHAQASVGHLIVMEKRVHETLKSVEKSYEAEPPLDAHQLHARMGMLSRDLSYIKGDAVQSIYHWELFHEKAVNAARKKSEVEGSEK